MRRKHQIPRDIPNPKTTPTITVPEAAAILGIGRDTAYQAVRAGDLPAIRLCGAIRIPTAALERLLAGDDTHDVAAGDGGSASTIAPRCSAGSIHDEGGGNATGTVRPP